MGGMVFGVLTLFRLNSVNWDLEKLKIARLVRKRRHLAFPSLKPVKRSNSDQN